MRRRHNLARLAVCSVAGVGTLALAGSAAAATFNVTGTGDSVAPCSGSSCPSLRSAVIASNSAGGTNTINVPAGHYILTRTPSGTDNAQTGDLNITANVTITGAGPGKTIITGKQDRIFDITANQVTLSGMAVNGGAVPSTSTSIDGGAVHDTGSTLTLINDLFSGNKTASNGFGGAVDMESANSGTLKVTGSVFRKNTAVDTGVSGGGFGGGIEFQPGSTGTLTITNTEFDSNNAQGGTRSGGGFGGGVEFETGDTGTLKVTGSTFNGNVAQGPNTPQNGGFGGGIDFEPGNSGSSMTITNSTFTANKATGGSPFGGAISFEPGTGSSGTLTHVTIAGNSTSIAQRGGGVYIEQSPLTVQNSIISGNTGGGTSNNNCLIDPALGSSLIAQGHNIEKGKSCGFDINADPLLAALANNGGPTKTMAIPASSPAHDAADPKFCPATDQRGMKRPDDAGTPCDIGAFEFTTPAPPKKHHHHHHHHHHHPPPPKKHHHHHHPTHKPHRRRRGFTG